MEDIIAREVLDYSGIHVVTRLLCERLNDCPEVFSEVKEASEELALSISPKSGLGLDEIWRTLSPSSLLEDNSQLEDLAQLSENLPTNKRGTSMKL